MAIASLDSTPATATWQALGTTALVRVTEPAALSRAVSILDRELREVDRVASSYRWDSELAHLNETSGRWTRISQLMSELLSAAMRAAEITGGLVDPAIGWLVASAPARADERNPRRATVHQLGWRDIALSADARAVRLPPGVRIDLGATGKALAADRAANDIADSLGGEIGVLVSLGGDISTAGPAPAGGWPIHVTDDHRSTTDAPGQRVSIDTGALATSSKTVRGRTEDDGTSGHHIVDPRTQRSAEGPWRTVSATAATCVDANTATTAAIVLGDEAPDWLAEQGIAARLVADDGDVLTIGGWPVGAAA